MPVSVGETLEKRYKIDRLLGKGGFGAVYHARDLRLDVFCAIKESRDTSKAATRQFKREASMLAELRHPNLPRVTDYFDLHEKGLYLVMDFIEGEDLATKIIRNGKGFTEEQVTPWLRQICEALYYLHSHNPPVIHRDIKPQNIIVTKDNVAVLVDFGLAKVYDPLKPTTTGAKGGTPGFSPVEQYGQGTTDQRSDIYSLGATIYALLTGQIPPESIQRVTNTASLKSIRTINPTVSAPLESAVLQALEIDPAKRIQTVKELINVLSGYNVTEERENDNSSLRIEKVTPSIPYSSPYPLQEGLQKPLNGTTSTSRLRSIEEPTSVYAVAVTPDGGQVVSGLNDKTLKVWDLKTGRLIRSLEGHTSIVWAVAITPDGAQVVSGSYDKTLKVWDLKTGRLIRSLEGHTGSVNAVAVTPDGAQIVSGADDRTLKVWDLKSGRLLRSLEEHTSPVHAVVVTPDGGQVVSGSYDKTLKVWDLKTGRLIRSLIGHTGSVIAVAITPDGAQVVSGSYDKTLKVWDLKTGRLIRSLEGHTESVNAVAVTPDGTQVVSGSRDKTLKVWDLKSGRLLRSLEGHTESVNALVVYPDGTRVISGSYDKTITVWDLQSDRWPAQDLPIPYNSSYPSQNGLQKPSNATTFAWLRSLQGHRDGVLAVAVTPDGAQAVSVSLDCTLKVWDLASGRLLRSWNGDSGSMDAVAVTPDGAQIVSGAQDGILKVWDLQSGRLIRALIGHTSGVTAVVVTPDGIYVVSGSYDKTLKVWDLQSGRLLRSLDGHKGRVGSLAVTPDGAQVVSGSTDNTLKVWDLQSGRLIRALIGHTSGVTAVVVTPDGIYVVSGSYDKTLKVWDLQSGRLLRSLDGHRGRVGSLAVTPDGAQVVSGSTDNTLKIWDLQSGRRLRSLKGHEEDVTAVVVTSNGTRVVSGSYDNTLKVWDLQGGRQPADQFQTMDEMQNGFQKPSEVTISTQLIETNVVGDFEGSVFEVRKEVVAELQIGEEVLLVRDPPNQYDRNAIKVIRQNGHKIGFLSRDLAAKLATSFDNFGQPVKANVAAFLWQKFSKTYLGVRIKFYPPEEIGLHSSWDDPEISKPTNSRLAGDTLTALGDPRFDPEYWHLPCGDMLGFLHIPAGKFRMGSNLKKDKVANEIDEYKKLETPQHELYLPDFWIAKYPVTVAQFKVFVEASGYEFDNWQFNPVVNHPVVGVVWSDALEYCKWLEKQLSAISSRRLAGKKSGIEKTFWQGLADGKLHVTLPSEAEWEKSARGTDGRIYPWGNEFGPMKANTIESRLGITSAVGCFPAGASPYGLLDMSGNVWEWTRSRWEEFTCQYPYKPDDGREKLSGWMELADHVLRGGSITSDSKLVRCAARIGFPSDYEYWSLDFGFRIAVSPALLS